jgi:hypothetical protein
VALWLKSLIFLKALSEGATLRLLDWESGRQELECRIEPGVYSAPDPKELLCFGALVFIQNRLGLSFELRSINIDGEGFAHIMLAAAAIQTGRAVLPSRSLNLSEFKNEDLPEDWSSYIGQPAALRIKFDEYKVNILGQSISLGPALFLYQGTVVQSLEESGEEVFLLHAVDKPFWAEFPAWIRQPDHEESSDDGGGEISSDKTPEGL